MRIEALSQLPAEATRTVIINVGTELVTTMALLSTLRHAPFPLLLINSRSTPASSDFFERLMAEYSFDLLDAPLRSHDQALDLLFKTIPAEVVMLVDSDAELCDHDWVGRARASFAHKRVFGAGFVDGPRWMDAEQRGGRPVALYHERAWLPCVMFRTAHIRWALRSGSSFAPRVTYNDFRPSQRVSRILALRLLDRRTNPPHALACLPQRLQDRMSRTELRWLRWARGDYWGHRPSYVYGDTGAALYHWCRHIKNLVFAGWPHVLAPGTVNHHVGVTRLHLNPQRTTGVRMAAVASQVQEQLRHEYDFDWDATTDGLQLGGS